MADESGSFCEVDIQRIAREEVRRAIDVPHDRLSNEIAGLREVLQKESLIHERMSVVLNTLDARAKNLEVTTSSLSEKIIPQVAVLEARVYDLRDAKVRADEAERRAGVARWQSLASGIIAVGSLIVAIVSIAMKLH